MSAHDDQFQENDLPSDIRPLARMLDARARAQRGPGSPDALSAEALERIASLSEMQLPLATPESPVVIARIGPDRGGSRWVWRVAAGLAAAALVGGVAWVISRGSTDEPAPGTLVQQDAAPAPVSPAVPNAAVPSMLPVELIERALAHASNARSATAVVVAISGSASDPSLHYHDVDDALAADIAPIFHSGSLLDGGGTTYEDLSGEFAAIVASMPPR